MNNSLHIARAFQPKYQTLTAELLQKAIEHFKTSPLYAIIMETTKYGKAEFNVFDGQVSLDANLKCREKSDLTYKVTVPADMTKFFQCEVKPNGN